MNEAAQYLNRPVGTRPVNLTPERIRKICALTRDGKVNGKPSMDENAIMREIGSARRDEYFRYICGGNAVAIALTNMFNWWADA